ncbi:hypothetical protein [Bacillus cereus group sp. BfR-BA-01383]|uniref:hypothetical protein n=1 Tax=Bacillus cereus group sp. BfR-BA-01383 TaxID=2920327 RepID=UPI001F594F65|nr:hypothetical protein [Bacillus cereus group sp. BfR-BA-01383]
MQSVDYFTKPVGNRVIDSFTDFAILYRRTLIVLIHFNYRQEQDAKTYKHATVIVP